MRILRGKFKGRRLTSFKADHIRPTTDRVKESIFNILMGQLEGAKVLDLFSGTGNLTIESLSQGAEAVTAVELSGKSVSIIRENIELFGVKEKVTLKKMDVLRFLKAFSGEPFDLIFIDPPFTKKMADPVMLALSESSCWSERSTIIIESSSQEKIEDSYGNLNLVDRRNYGDKLVSIFEPSSSGKE